MHAEYASFNLTVLTRMSVQFTGLHESLESHPVFVRLIPKHPQAEDLEQQPSEQTSENETLTLQKQDNRWLLLMLQAFLTSVFFVYELAVFLPSVYELSNAESIQQGVFGFGYLFVILPFMMVSSIGACMKHFGDVLRASQHPKPSFRLFLGVIPSILAATTTIPVAKRRQTFFNSFHFPWMTLLLVSIWTLFYIAGGPVNDEYRQACPFSAQCPDPQTRTVTMCNFLANFVHLDAMHLTGNIFGAILQGLATESLFGSWRCFLPVCLGVPLLQPIYGQCGSVGGSAIVGLIGGVGVSVWIWQICESGFVYRRFAVIEGLAITLGMNGLMNFAGVLSEWVDINGGRVAHSVHAESQIVGFLLGTLCMISFHKITRKASVPNDVDEDYLFNSEWSRWWNFAASFLGIASTLIFISLGLALDF